MQVEHAPPTQTVPSWDTRRMLSRAMNGSLRARCRPTENRTSNQVPPPQCLKMYRARPSSSLASPFPSRGRETEHRALREERQSRPLPWIRQPTNLPGPCPVPILPVCSSCTPHTDPKLDGSARSGEHSLVLGVLPARSRHAACLRGRLGAMRGAAFGAAVPAPNRPSRPYAYPASASGANECEQGLCRGRGEYILLEARHAGWPG
jgi:hypothetical protein